MVEVELIKSKIEEQIFGFRTEPAIPVLFHADENAGASGSRYPVDAIEPGDPYKGVIDLQHDSEDNLGGRLFLVQMLNRLLFGKRGQWKIARNKLNDLGVVKPGDDRMRVLGFESPKKYSHADQKPVFHFPLIEDAEKY
jgi:hypothetical protein